MPTRVDKVWTEFTGAGSVYKVIEQYKKVGLNANGEKLVFITPEVIQKKNTYYIN